MAKKTNAELIKEIANLEGKILILETGEDGVVKLTEADHATLLEKIANYEASVDEYKGAIETLTSEKTDLSTKLDIATKELKNSGIEEAQLLISKLKEENKKLKADNSELRAIGAKKGFSKVITEGTYESEDGRVFKFKDGNHKTRLSTGETVESAKVLEMPNEMERLIKLQSYTIEEVSDEETKED